MPDTEIFKYVAGKYIRHVKTGRTWHPSAVVTELNATKQALSDVLDDMGALGGGWHELCSHGFSEERAKEIIGLIE